ncbi:MAG: NTP transferase domain-containing protein [candidate division Zixibacteria bacterium]|nr:NTP transferase domain-containing protein [candidate division Zixibacteria bacterium]
MQDKKAAVVLAAGKGKRMKSNLPKVLHEVGGKPMIKILIEKLIQLEFEKIIVIIGYEGEKVQTVLADYPVEFVWQREQLGTGHAVMMAKEVMKDFDGITLVALGDVPFLSELSIDLLIDMYKRTNATACCLSAILQDPSGYGRIVRKPDTNILEAIVEHKDASEETLRINEINSGTFCFDNKKLFEYLEKIDNNNEQGEYYLTDTIKLMHDNQLSVSVVATENPDELRGINSVEQLDELARIFSDRLR